MVYELWDTESANLLASYPSKALALAFVREVVHAYGREAVADWELMAMDDGVSAQSVAFGADLADRALSDFGVLRGPRESPSAVVSSARRRT
jgi:hypothetical protein